MFADDIVMIASSAEELQRMFDCVGLYGVRWRFKFNFGVDKTAVLVCGGVYDGETWMLNGIRVPVVDNYKYLGVRLVSTGGWKLRRDDMLTKARGAFWKAWGLGMGGGWLSPLAAKGLYETMVRPVMEYGSEVDSGRWIEVEKIQKMAGRMCLGVNKNVPDVVVRGELGWWNVRARREYLRVVYWGKVVRERVGSLVRCVYEEGRKRLRDGRAGKREWCVETKRLIYELGLGDIWETESVGDDVRWKNIVRGMMQEREEIWWRREVAQKCSLDRYMRVKEQLREEWFLKEPRVWVAKWVGLRAGVTCLEATRGRYRKPRVIRRDRVCTWCESGSVEDEDHFLGECERWSGVRSEIWNEMRMGDRDPVKKIEGVGGQERVDWMVRGGCSVRPRGLLLVRVGSWLFSRERMGEGSNSRRQDKETNKYETIMT